MLKGTIHRLVSAEGFGFIKTDEGEELFFHRNDLQGLEFSKLKEGQEVQFDIAQSSDSSCAVKVRLAKSKHG